MNKAFFVDSTMGFASKLRFGLISLNPIAIGTIEYPEFQSDCAIAIGDHAGFYNQGEYAIAIGESAGRTNQSSLAIAIGAGAGESNQSQHAIALGVEAGQLSQGTGAVAIGTEAAESGQLEHAIAIGSKAGQSGQDQYAIAIGYEAANYSQDDYAIAIGYQAGQRNQEEYTVALGYQAAQTSQDDYAIAIGYQAGQYSQDDYAIAIGYQAGQTSQDDDAIAIGRQAGQYNQDNNAIAIGRQAGQNTQGTNAVAIGFQAGQENQGENAVAIGNFAGQTNQPVNSIVLNASGSSMSGVTQASACYIHPIRLNSSSSYASNNLLYDTTTREVVRQPNPVVVGDIKFSAQGGDHNNWLLCDGRQLQVANYPALHAVIGYSFGGAGANFNLPDPRSRVLGAAGPGGGGLSARNIGDAVGAETHTLTVNEMPSHNHGVTDPGHSHSYVNQPQVQNTDNAFSTESAADNVNVTQTSGTSTTGITINNTGGGLAHNNMQPTLFIGNVFIYAGY